MSNPIREAQTQASTAKEVLADVSAQPEAQDAPVVASIAIAYALLAIHYDLQALVASR